MIPEPSSGSRPGNSAQFCSDVVGIDLSETHVFDVAVDARLFELRPEAA